MADVEAMTAGLNEPTSEEEGISRLKAEEAFLTLKDAVQSDIEFTGQWRKRAKEDFRFVDAENGQWTPEEVQALTNEQRPVISFNKTSKFIRAVCGIEANNRHETTFLPREVDNEGDVAKNELLSSCSAWMEDGCDALRQQSRSFRDTTVCGMGWTEALVEFDTDPKGAYVETRCDPLEMGWDRNSRDANLADSKRRWRIRKMSIAEARALPGIPKDVTDDELDASWASEALTSDKPETKTQRQKELREENTLPSGMKREVTIVQVQWWEYEPYIYATVPETGQNAEVTEEQYGMLNKAYQQKTGKPLPRAQLRRKVYKQAFLGSIILGEITPCPNNDGFTFNVITFEPDHDGTWYGLVRLYRDPQKWTNKLFSQTMHIVNSTAKGGVLFEASAVADPRQFQETFAKPNAATEVAEGAISKGKIMAKPGVGITSGVLSLLQIAENAFPDVGGINMEILGLSDRNQPGVLEAQRKQAAMTILATLFDSYAAFKRDVGRVRLNYIQTYFADDRIIRIAGPEGAKGVKMLKDKMLGKYDVVVDEAPSSPNTKDKTWAALQLLLAPLAQQGLLTKEVVGLMLPYVPGLPLPLVHALQQLAQQPPDPRQGQMQQIEMRKNAADATYKEASAAAAESTAILNLAKAGAENAAASATAWESLLATMGLGGQKPMLPIAPEDPNSVMGPSTPPMQPMMPQQAAVQPDQQPQQPELPMAMPNGVALPGGLINGGA